MLNPNRIIQNRLMSNCDHAIPPWSFEQWLKTSDDTSIFSWWYTNEERRKGTVFILHGYRGNCGYPMYGEIAKRIADKYGLWAAAIDFRGHGKSQAKTPSFGYAEHLDVVAALSHAEFINAPKPYILLGESYGGMVAQLTAMLNNTVNAAICLQPPGWAWDAIGCTAYDLIKNTMHGLPLRVLNPVAYVGNAINSYYGRKILDQGNVQNFSSYPIHEPYMLYVMGTYDKYNIEHVKEIWNHWYNGTPAEYGKWPAEAPNQKKWFIEGPWWHTDQTIYWEQTVMGYDRRDALINEFVEHVLNRL